MIDERGLVALLYRADWRELSLSCEVRGGGGLPGISMVTHGGLPRPGEPFPPPGAVPETDVTLLVAPGKRYRVARASGQGVQGCDGERAWERGGELPPDTELRLYGGEGPPCRELLAPSWLLSGYDLAIEGEATACGRPAIRVAATARGRARDRTVAPPFWGSPVVMAADRVVALVDAELGILLRCGTGTGSTPLAARGAAAADGRGPMRATGESAGRCTRTRSWRHPRRRFLSRFAASPTARGCLARRFPAGRRSPSAGAARTASPAGPCSGTRGRC